MRSWILRVVGLFLVGSMAQADEPIQTKFGAKLYGRIKLDAAYDFARTDDGNFAKWVLSEADKKDDDQFNMTARESRVGLWLYGPDVAEINTKGRLEIDFYEGGAENKNRLMLRHVYMQLDWPEYDMSLIAGQTSDVISPLVISTLNYSVGWWVGNIGYRRPQVRLTKNMDLNGDSVVILEGALTRTIGDDWGDHPGDTGEDAGFPTVQGRVAVKTPLFQDKLACLGISGHWGQEEYDPEESGSSRDFDSWSVNLDLEIPILDQLCLKGEFFTGENLDAYLGGIGQGVNRIDLKEVYSTGGWVALDVKLNDKWNCLFGASIDDPKDSDLPQGARARNTALFANAMYDITEAVKTGVEVSFWDTRYVGLDKGDSIRCQGSFIYTF